MPDHRPSRAGLVSAIKQAGGQKELAGLLSTPARLIRQGHVWSWLNTTKAGIPPELCPVVELKTGVTCEVLRPDLRWHRDIDNRVIAYAVPLDPVETGKAVVLHGVEGQDVDRVV